MRRIITLPVGYICKPDYFGTNIIDYIVCTRHMNYSNVEVLNAKFADSFHFLGGGGGGGGKKKAKKLVLTWKMSIEIESAE